MLQGPRQPSDQDFDRIHPSSMKNNNMIVSIQRIPSGKRSSKQWT